ncbi:MAG: glycosyltransferase [Candidatus Diapherotrites archaeon]|nr:glycosyltransferase [Candidatus Diapherotrites archaeon]
MKISVVIPAHNRDTLLKETLQALLNQNFPKQEYEIIVVGYYKNTTKKVIQDLNSSQIKYFEIDSPWPDQKRNVGWKNANTNIVAFTDDDCIPQKDWLTNLVHAFNQNPDIAGIEGKTTQDNQKLFFHATENLTGRKFPACNFAVKKEWLEKIHGFDESYHFFREDTDLAFKIISANGKILFDPSVIVYHPPRKISWKNILNEIILIKGDVRLYKKFPKLYSHYLGFLCKSSWKQSFFSWTILFLITYALILNFIIGVFTAIILLFIFRFIISMQGKRFSIQEFLIFNFTTVIRDLLFPFYFFYYWITIKVS